MGKPLNIELCRENEMNQSIKKILMASVFIIGIAVGLIHHRLGMTSIFVFNNNEPLSSWICIISGPMSTLPAVVTALFNKKFAGYWLVLGGIMSFAAFATISPGMEYMLQMLIRIFIPMILIGVAFIGIASANKNESATHNQEDTPDPKTVR
jgi:hypothetical protein